MGKPIIHESVQACNQKNVAMDKRNTQSIQDKLQQQKVVWLVYNHNYRAYDKNRYTGRNKYNKSIEPKPGNVPITAAFFQGGKLPPEPTGMALAKYNLQIVPTLPNKRYGSDGRRRGKTI